MTALALCSVVVPTRDRPDLLATTLAGVLAQRDVDLEVLLVDDGSQPPLPAHRDSRVRLLRHDAARGVSASRNHGIAEARGDWVAFSDDDDLWAPDKLAAQLAAAERTGRNWAIAGAVSFDHTGAVVGVDPPLPAEQLVDRLRRINAVPVGASNVVARASLLARTGGFDTALRHMADWDLWLRLAAEGLPATVDRPLVAYRLHRTSATMDTAIDAAEPLAEHDRIVARHGIPGDRAAQHRWVGWACLRAGRRLAAARAYGRAAAEGDWLSVARLGVALVHPRAGRDTFFRPLVKQDPRWVEEAGRWLRERLQR